MNYITNIDGEVFDMRSVGRIIENRNTDITEDIQDGDISNPDYTLTQLFGNKIDRSRNEINYDEEHLI